MNPRKYFSPKYWQRKFFSLRPIGANYLPESEATDATRVSPLRSAIGCLWLADPAPAYAAAAIPSSHCDAAPASPQHWATALIRAAKRITGLAEHD